MNTNPSTKEIPISEWTSEDDVRSWWAIAAPSSFNAEGSAKTDRVNMLSSKTKS
jgi:hypothetical protein